MSKKKFIVIFSFLLFSFSSILGHEYGNVFFGKAEKSLSNLKELQNKVDENSYSSRENFKKRRAKEGLLLKELQFFLKKCLFYKLTTDGIKSLELDGLCKQVDGQQYRVLNNDDIFCNKEEKELLQEFFNFVRIGIIYELVFDHLVIFRKSLIGHLNDLYLLVDYWTKEIDSYSWWEKIKNIFFEGSGKEYLKAKTENLILFKDRLAAFIGKVDELFLRFARDIHPFLLKNCEDMSYVVKEITLFMEESIFCISSFFSKQVDPDSKNYGEELTNFNNLSLMEKMQQLCRNHMAILLIEEGFHFVLTDYAIPGFFQRHWLLLSLGSIGGVVGGIYLYQNWDYLASDDEKSPKNRVIKFSKETYDWITDSFTNLYTMIKNRLWPDEQALTILEDHKNSFSKRFEETCNKLHKDGLLDVKKPESLRPLFDALSKFKKNNIGKQHEKLKDGHEAFKKHNESFNDNLTKFNGALNLGDENKQELGQNEKKFSIGGTGWLVLSNDFREALEKTIPIVKNWVEGLQSKLENIKKDDLGKNTFNSLTDVVKDIINLINSLIPQVGNLGVVMSIWEAALSKVIADALDKMAIAAKTGEVTLNWVKALIPVMLTIIVAPTTSYLIIKGILKSRRQRGIDRINFIVCEIYRILIHYKSSSFDYYHHDLKYKDQGLLSFWIEKLKEGNKALSFDDKKRLKRLVGDLKNPNFSVEQKIDFINVEWGNRLFVSNVAA